MWLLASILASVIGAVVAGVGSKRQENAQQQANETNLQIARETNQANAEQAELAYKRSLPVNQVSNMMAAGMSKSAALQSLSGGGSYSAPVMQSAQVNPAYGDLSALAERIAGIPSNAVQSKMVKQQLEMSKAQLQSMRLDNDIKREQLEMAKAAAARDAAVTSSDLESKQYDFETLKQTDALRAIISKRAAEFNVNLNDIKSEQDLIDKLKLNDVAEWRDARSSSRDNILTYLGVSNTMRNSNQSAQDAHRRMVAEYNDYKAAKGAREKEYHLREMAATFEQMLISRNMSQEWETIKDNFEFKDGKLVLNPDGTPKINNAEGVEAYGKIRGFWRDLSDIIPINVLGDVIRLVLKK